MFDNWQVTASAISLITRTFLVRFSYNLVPAETKGCSIECFKPEVHTVLWWATVSIHWNLFDKWWLTLPIATKFGRSNFKNFYGSYSYFSNYSVIYSTTISLWHGYLKTATRFNHTLHTFQSIQVIKFLEIFWECMHQERLHFSGNPYWKNPVCAPV